MKPGKLPIQPLLLALVPALCTIGFACGGAQKSDLAQLTKRVEKLEKSAEDAEKDEAVMGLLASTLKDHEERLDDMESARRKPPREIRGPSRPDPQAVYSIAVGNSPIVGPKKAWVTIVDGFEFACPYCERSRPTIDQLLKDYKGEVRVVYKHYVVHPTSATIPAKAACAAHLQGKFKKMYELIWDQGFNAGRNLSMENMVALGKKAGLKIGKMKKDMAKKCEAIVKADQAALAKVGVTGTPSFYINGRLLSGARPLDQFKELVDEELAKAKASGISVSNYYPHVVKTGVKEFKR